MQTNTLDDTTNTQDTQPNGSMSLNDVQDFGQRPIHRVWARAFFRALSKHGNATRAAREAGVHPRWIQTLKGRDARFRRRHLAAMEQAKKARADRVGDVVDALYDMAVVGDTTTTYTKGGDVYSVTKRRSAQAAIAYAKAYDPKRWDRPKNVKITQSPNQVSDVVRAMLVAQQHAVMHSSYPCSTHQPSPNPSMQPSLPAPSEPCESNS